MEKLTITYLENLQPKTAETDVAEGRVCIRRIAEILGVRVTSSVQKAVDRFDAVLVKVGRTKAVALLPEDLPAWMRAVSADTATIRSIEQQVMEQFGNFRTQRAAETRAALESRIAATLDQLRDFEMFAATAREELHDLQVQLLLA